ncbi:4Fe-4S dicluster domain-containing protein [Senegalimassilia anaerobia]
MTEKKVPVLFFDDSECCGCSACYAVCPKGAIRMIPNRHGFLYPKIDEVVCVRCGKCLSVCAFKKKLA